MHTNDVSIAEMESRSATSTSEDDGLGRRSFLKGMGVTGAAALSGSLLFAEQASAKSGGGLSKGDAAILRFLAAAELIETDLWEQYAELGGVNGGNPAYIAALTNIDSDMPTYIALNTEDEQSHAAFLNAYLSSHGAQPVNLDRFRTLPSSKATGAKQTGRLTTFHFAFIESGGSSLYTTLSDQVSSAEVLRIVASIGGTENQHFATWQDDAGNAAATPIAPVTDPVTGLTIPDLNKRADKALFATNRIFPHPCDFIDSRLPQCSIVRPTDPRFGGARAAVKAFTDDGLFIGQSPAFFAQLMALANQADAAQRS
jgi:Ferritin-like domain